ncbi:MAG: enoyl-CoA hydratase-related protein [Clostridia bacterium]|nr:enoyl-CoA hydratase-related protein [Clostridia bacterium]
MIEKIMEGVKNIRGEERDGIAFLFMNRPKALNALNTETLGEIVEIMDRIADDREIKGVILSSDGRAFIAGADISGFKDFSSAEGRKVSERGQAACDAIERLEKPVIAAVNGFALGGGCEVAMACDIRIASTKAVFGQPEVNLGLIPCFGGTQRLTRLVGSGIAKELIFTARQVKADEALRIGLVNKVVEPDELISAAEEMMRLILKKSPSAVSCAKVAINKGAEMDMFNALELEKNMFAVAYSMPDAVEGTSAFLEKREAKF